MNRFLVATLGLLGAVGLAQASVPVTHSAAGHPANIVVPAATTAVLYDQMDAASSDDVRSQDFEAAFVTFTNQAADDFVVPAGQTWNVTGVDVVGDFTAVPPAFNVYFYENAATTASFGFAAQQTFATGSSPWSVTAADVNGDGNPDLIVANWSDSTVSVLLNITARGATTPSFAVQQTFATGTMPMSVTVADVNGDGMPDLIVANWGGSTVSVLLNTTVPGDTTASFAAQQTFATGALPRSVTVADVNGDGIPDLIVANQNDNTVSVLLNTTVSGDTTASFATQQTFATGVGPWSVTAADVNGDGKPDLIVANVYDATVSVLLNTTATGATTASFATQQTFATGVQPWSVTAADVNGDGKPDLIAANTVDSTVSVLLNTTATGATTPSFTAQQTFITESSPDSVTAADVNADGKPDLIVANGGGATVSVLLNTTVPGDTTASFAAQQAFATGSWASYSVTTADVNGDGKPDLIVANNGSNTASVLLNTSVPAADLPGTLVTSELSQTYTGGAASGDTAVITLATPVSLPAGTYWVSVQARLDLSPNGQWFWANRATQSNSPAAWQNPGGAFGFCPTWSVKTTCFPTSVGADQLFRLNGTSSAPSATVTPASLSFTVAANASENQTVNIANAAGSTPLTFSIAALASSINKPTLVPHVGNTQTSKADLAAAAAGKQFVPRHPATLSASGPPSHPSHPAPWSPRAANGSAVDFTFQLDDGTAENAVGWVDNTVTPWTEAGAVWINRFSASGALTIDSISIYWPDATQGGGDLTGLQPNLVVYYDAGSTGSPTNAVRLGTDDLVTISTLAAFQTYTTSFSVPGAGDIYIGFVDQWALAGGYTPALFPAALDQSSPPAGMSWISAAGTAPTDITTLANNDNNGTIDSFGLPGNWLIRATGTGGGGAPCTGVPIAWLTANPSSGTVNGGANTDVTVTADPTAGGLVAGNYTGALCVTTNDPTQPVIAIPVTLTVTATPTVAKSFAPASVVVSTDSTATITLGNPTAGAATLTANLVDTLPAGLVAMAGSAATTCAGGAGASTTGATITLGAGAVIPANGSCTLTATVQAATVGSYVNTIAVGDLQTSIGNNDTAASATLTVTPVVAPPPVIVVTPTALAFTLQAGASGTDPLNIANTGGSNLTFSVSEGTGSIHKPTSYKTSRDSKVVHEQLAKFGPGSLAQNKLARNHAVGQPVALAPTDISQMADNSPGDQGVSCGVQGTSTADNSWWRRFYFSEYPGVGASMNVNSVTISSGSTGPTGLPITINLYTIPHGTPIDTIPTASLTLIGSGTGTIDSGLLSVTIPVSGAVADTVGTDLVVEYHTDGNVAGGTFYPGANATPETHPTFMSSTTCGIAEPATAASIGFPDFHLTMIVSLGDATLPTCANQADIPWLSEAPVSGTVAPGASTDVTVTADAATLLAGDYTANVCVGSNDPVNPLVTVPVTLTVTPAPFVPCSGGADEIFCDGFEMPAGGAGTYTNRTTFLTHVAAGFYENPFNDAVPGAIQSLSYTNGGWAYTVTASTDQLYNDTGLISTNASADSIVVTFTGSPVTAVGGNFWATDINVLPTGTVVTILLSDGTTVAFTSTGPADFRGFTTALPITRITIDALDVPNPAWSTMDNLIIGISN
jgi:hypothetical protein